MMHKTLTPPAFVAPLSFTFPVDDDTVVIEPLGVADIAEVMTLCAPVLDELLTLDDGSLARLQDGSPSMADLHHLLGVLERHGQAGIDLVAIGARKSSEWVGKLLPDRFAYVFSVVVLVNADFFSRARPAFSAAGAVLAQAKADQAASTGQASSTP